MNGPLCLAAVLTVVASVSAVEPPRAWTPPAPLAPKHVIFSGGDGTGCDRAVVLRGAKGARDHVAAQKAWLHARYPGYEYRDNSVESIGKRHFQTIDIATSTGERKSVCFDITEGFGELG